MRARIMCLSMFMLTLTILAQGVLAQAPGNRELHRFSVVPDPGGGGGQIVTAHWTVDVEASSVPLDYSTEVQLWIGGTLAQSRTASVWIDAGSGGSCGFAPPCEGSCGTGQVNGATVTLQCFEDVDAAGSDCDCGVWIHTEFDPVPLTLGTPIEVHLIPVPGTAPENESNDNGVDEEWEGEPLGWNREVESIELVDAGAGAYDVRASLSLSWEGLAGTLNLDLAAELHLNGVLLSSTSVPAQARQVLDQGCFALGCGSGCGSMNGVPAYCDPYLWWDCGCGGWLLAEFPGVDLDPGDEIMILLRPVPGALPELPGFEDDDLDRIVCCEVLDVDDVAASSPLTLDQNRPNPFNPRTSISFDIAHSGAARLDIFDADGRLVRSLLDRSLGSGNWTVTWDGRDGSGQRVASGTYFYRLTSPEGSQTRRMTLLK